MKRPEIAIEHVILPNGLAVVVAPDHTAPVATVGVYYKVGSRQDPRGRSGFAHLFEHLMFQGSANTPKGAHIKLINSSGGRANASTSKDLTYYFEAVPSNALERVLWLEADRMRALKVDDENLRNQRDVVKEEICRNVLNQPYGSFPWLDLPAVAFRNWANVHSLYGTFEDLDAVRLEEVQTFFKSYYLPNNAVIVILGDIDTEEAIAMSTKYFGDIPAGPRVRFADIEEPVQTEERCGFVEEKFAELPAVAVGYSIPKRGTPDWYAMALLDRFLHVGKAAKVKEGLVLDKQIAVDAFGGIDDLFDCDGPSQMVTQIHHRADVSNETALAAFDSIIREIQQTGVTHDELDQTKVLFRSEYFSRLETGGSYMPRFGLMHLLACFTLFDSNPYSVNEILYNVHQITEDQLLAVAGKYLRKDNRAIVYRVPIKRTGTKL